MPQKQSVVLALLFLLSLGVSSGTAAALPDPASSNFRVYSVPPPASDMILQDLRGKPVSLSGLRGKVVILNFWKIDCPPCSAEKPILERIYRKYSGKGLEIVAVNLTDPQSQLQAYVQRGGFSFTFAFDPANRFSLRKDTIRPGMQTTVVVNPNLEAIYEVPGVPTSYVIDRRGQVVGNSVGMANWEEPAMMDFLESLLQPPIRTASADQSAEINGNQPAFREDARALPAPASKGGAQLRLASAENTGEGPLHQPEQTPYPPTTAPQGFNAPTASVESPAQLQKPRQSPSPAKPQQPATRKPELQQVDKKPKPATTAKAAQPAKPLQTGTAATRRDLPAYSAGQQSPTGGPVTQGGPGATTLPQLPPGIPYTPPGGQSAPGAAMIPDENGTVTARIPGAAGSNLPAAQQVASPNPIGGFILDSFGRASAPPQAPKPISIPGPQSGAQAQQPANIIQQIGQDFQNLGTGIKDTFSRFVPGK